ncbi:LPPG:FO 2-phospho-L-lactate transferase CofD/UPF0052 [Rhabdaerophilaceae bacterium]
MNKMKVAIFCGGRGSQYIIRELLRWPDIELTLLVNAYDDGLSTGALRALIPGMLGPSDFRKNLSYLLGLYSRKQVALQRLIEYRFPEGFNAHGRETLDTYARSGEVARMPAEWQTIHGEVLEGKRQEIQKHIARFMAYWAEKSETFNLDDCSFGNLLFAGIYLGVGESFNRAADVLGQMVDSEATLCNVSKGENRTLTAVKADGQILTRESEVVGKQSDVRIREIFFTEKPVPAEVIASLDSKPLEEKLAYFRERQLGSDLSDEAGAAIRDADVILYGPGTQHSSLFPSYIIAGKAIAAAKAPIKAFVSNLHFDHDIHGYSTNDLVEQALHYLGDAENTNRVITHVVATRATGGREDAIDVDEARLGPGGTIKGAQVLRGAFQNPSKPDVHSGFAIVKAIRDLGRATVVGTEAGRSVDLFFDIYRRGVLLDVMMQEISEIDWSSRFDKVKLTLNRLEAPKKSPLPAFVTTESVSYKKVEPELYALKQWLRFGTSEYLVTITGDGEYRIRDVMTAFDLLDHPLIGIIYGTRAQSRRQLRTSLRHAYGDGLAVRLLSRLGTFVVTAMFALRHGVVFSDPFTGIRVYRRSALPEGFKNDVMKIRSSSSTKITNLLLRHDVEVCEMPVSYRTFPDFTDFKWRLKRGVRNLLGLFG